ncbi:MAG: TonB-dependent receptor, partial [Candidatus Kapabacteria bacterium]|jgi:outer membrane receptor for ferrienterochelin and colicins|nr:TonB-dependent receptor [Candidatus Kapabacteria bacterium]
MLNLIYSLPLYDINLNLFYKYSGKLIGFYAVSDVEYDKFEIGDYHTMDISLSKEVGDKFVTLVAGIKNLFDVTEISRIGSDGNFHSDASTSNPVAWGRTVNVSIRFNLK